MLRSYLSFYMLITFVRSFHIFAFFLLLSDCKITPVQEETARLSASLQGKDLAGGRRSGEELCSRANRRPDNRQHVSAAR